MIRSSSLPPCAPRKILIPLEHSAQDHQRMNAYELAKVGASLVLEDSNLGENMFFEKIEKIMMDENLRMNMGQRINAFYHPNAASNIAEGVINLARE